MRTETQRFVFSPQNVFVIIKVSFCISTEYFGNLVSGDDNNDDDNADDDDDDYYVDDDDDNDDDDDDDDNDDDDDYILKHQPLQMRRGRHLFMDLALSFSDGYSNYDDDSRW